MAYTCGLGPEKVKDPWISRDSLPSGTGMLQINKVLSQKQDEQLLKDSTHSCLLASTCTQTCKHTHPNIFLKHKLYPPVSLWGLFLNRDPLSPCPHHDNLNRNETMLELCHQSSRGKALIISLVFITDPSLNILPRQ